MADRVDRRNYPAMVLLWAYLGACRDELPPEIVADFQTRFDGVEAALAKVVAERDDACEHNQMLRGANDGLAGQVDEVIRERNAATTLLRRSRDLIERGAIGVFFAGKVVREVDQFLATYPEDDEAPPTPVAQEAPDG